MLVKEFSEFSSEGLRKKPGKGFSRSLSEESPSPVHMQRLLAQLEHHAREQGASPAIESAQAVITYGQLLEQVKQLSEQLAGTNCRHVGLMLDNCPQWIIYQLAAWRAGLVVTPIPLFFSNQQVTHQINASGVDLLVCADSERVSTLGLGFSHLPDVEARVYARATPLQRTPPWTVIVTYTSGTTGQPKGVCLGESLLADLAESLWGVIEDLDISRHLSLLPLSVLLENVAGSLLTLYAGACCILESDELTGLKGSGELDLQQFSHFLNHKQPHSLILVPELLKALLWAVTEDGYQHQLKFVAVGGGVVSRAVLEAAMLAGIPLYQGYGLSECGSVVCLNRPDRNRLGTVGEPLPHCKVSLADDGEILVEGAAMLGYLGSDFLFKESLKKSVQESDQKSNSQANNETNIEKLCSKIYTGDSGFFDDTGALTVSGRKKNLIINSYGRNLSPEWIEAEMMASPLVAQACLVGDGRPFNVALIHPVSGSADEEIECWFAYLNQQLPDYARITRWLGTSASFGIDNGMLTANGCLRRDAIQKYYQREISDCYGQETL